MSFAGFLWKWLVAVLVVILVVYFVAPATGLNLIPWVSRFYGGLDWLLSKVHISWLNFPVDPPLPFFLPTFSAWVFYWVTFTGFILAGFALAKLLILGWSHQAART